MPKIVEQQYDEATDSWTARVDGELVSGRTPRQLRSVVARALGEDSAAFEITTKIERAEQRELNSILNEAKAVEALRKEYLTRLDKLNVRRLNFAERSLNRRFTMEMVAEILDMQPARVQQLTDHGHYLGRKIRAVRDGRLPPGSPPERGSKDEAGEG